MAQKKKNTNFSDSQGAVRAAGKLSVQGEPECFLIAAGHSRDQIKCCETNMSLACCLRDG